MAKSLGSRYVLQEALGRGAMGQVFAGRIRPTGEPVAIKVLRPELVSDPEVVARFVQERTILMSIADPHVVGPPSPIRLVEIERLRSNGRVLSAYPALIGVDGESTAW